MASSVDGNRKFSERISSTPAIFKTTFKLFGSQGCSDDKNCLDFSAFSLRFVRFQSMRSDFRLKFDSGVIFLDQSQFFASFCIDNSLCQMAFFRVRQSGQRPAFDLC